MGLILVCNRLYLYYSSVHLITKKTKFLLFVISSSLADVIKVVLVFFFIYFIHYTKLHNPSKKL